MNTGDEAGWQCHIGLRTTPPRHWSVSDCNGEYETNRWPTTFVFPYTPCPEKNIRNIIDCYL